MTVAALETALESRWRDERGRDYLIQQLTDVLNSMMIQGCASSMAIICRTFELFNQGVLAQEVHYVSLVKPLEATLCLVSDDARLPRVHSAWVAAASTAGRSGQCGRNWLWPNRLAILSLASSMPTGEWPPARRIGAALEPVLVTSFVTA